MPLFGFETKRRTEKVCKATADLSPAKVEEINATPIGKALKTLRINMRQFAHTITFTVRNPRF